MTRMKLLKNKIIRGSLSVAMLFCISVFPSHKINLLPNQNLVVHAAAQTNDLPSNAKDGVIFHAFDWSFSTIQNELPNIAAAGYKSIQVSPVQGTKEASTDPSKWWLLYQPTNESVGNSQLGTYTQFSTLCSEAKKYGIGIIVDVVMNHMANNGNADQLAPQVESDFQDRSLYHNRGQCNNYNNRELITQECIGNPGEPDLDTQSSAVQSKAITFLNQCIDAGASGFRFDAAKHIETDLGQDANQPWSGRYWENVLGSLHNKSSLYIYGEVLQDGTVDNISAYESFMDVTASSYGYNLRDAITSNDLSKANNMGGLNPKNCVDFVETHDNYEDNVSSSLKDWQRKLGWAIVASRAGSTPLFFDRPTGSIGSEGDGLWKDADVVAVNKFHNAMIGQNEYLRWTNNNQTMLIDRGTAGTVIVNAGGSTYLNTATNLANGTYTNHGTANATLTVSNGQMTGNIPANSIVVLYGNNPIPTPVVSYNPTTPSAGSAVTITYDASNSILKNSTNVSAHWGYDGWKSATNTAMTSLGNSKWQVTLTVPTATTSNLNLCFTDGTNWDNNSSANWSINVTATSKSFSPRAGYTVDYDSSTLTKGSQFTLYYNGKLTNSSNVTLHYGFNGWTSTANATMTKRSDGFWQATITLPSTATKLDFCFTDGSSWDNNNSQDWHLGIQ